MLTGEVGVGGTVELRLQEVFDELCPSEEEDPWPDQVNLEGLGDLVDMEIEQFVKIGGKRKGEAQTAPPAKKAPKLSRGKEQVFLRSKVLSNPHLFSVQVSEKCTLCKEQFSADAFRRHNM